MANQLQTSQPRQAGESEPSWLLRIMNAIIADIKYIASLFNKTYSGIFINGDGDTVTVDKGLIISVEAPPLPLRLTWDDIGNALYTSVENYNGDFGSDFTTLTVYGNDQLLTGNSTTFAMPINTFNSNTSIVAINDEAESITSLGQGAFLGCTLLTTAIFPACTSTSDSIFKACTALTTVTLPLCADLGGTTGDDNVFNVSGNTITLTIAASRETCDGGNPDGDIVYLEANNTATIIYI